MTEKPSAILFDAGGTLVLQDPDAMSERLGIPVDPDAAFEAHYLTMSEFSAHRIGGAELTWDWWLEVYFGRLGHPEPAAAGPAIDRGFGLWTWPIPGVVEAVRRLASSGVRVGVVSNSDGSVEQSLRRAGFDGLFEFVIDSELVGVKKPDPGIFEIALERLGLDRSLVWYVGDSEYHDVRGARAAGLARGILVDPLRVGKGDTVFSVSSLPGLLGLADGGATT